MKQYIDKSLIMEEIERRRAEIDDVCQGYIADRKMAAEYILLNELLDFLDTIEVKDPYEQCIQYDSIKAGIQAHAETYSFNIESKLFNQLTKEQQELWREEIEQTCISGGNAGIELARDPRYKENLEEVDIEKEFDKCCKNYIFDDECEVYTARKFFELGIKIAQKEDKA